MEKCTGFMAIFDENLKTIKRIQRMPRGAGSITSVVTGEDGSLYMAGAATDRIKNWKKPMRTETVPDPKGVSKNTWGAQSTYLAKLTPDAQKVEWLIVMKGWSISPVLTMMENGNIGIHGPGVRFYTPKGKLVSGVGVENTRVLGGLSINPMNGNYTRVGDWMSPTGREPYRAPRCAVMNPDGSTFKELYMWRGPFLGIDSIRLIADSAVRKTFSPKTDIYSFRRGVKQRYVSLPLRHRALCAQSSGLHDQ